MLSFLARVELHSALLLSLLTALTSALRYDPEQVHWNLNTNPNATTALEYSGKWEDHDFYASPESWRVPFYVLTLDRFVDGDPTNNDANGTVFEHDFMANQFRFGGDAVGLQTNLDYIQGMGFKALYLAGSPFINMPWSGDGYGPLDFTLLDHHHGIIQDWRNLVDEIHRRGMYVILDNTMATMGDLLGFKGWMNVTAPFKWHEYEYEWKADRHYLDFEPSNEWNDSCVYPDMYGEDGWLLPQSILDKQDGCRAGEFDLYGSIKGVGAYPSYESQLSKFASVQDRLKEWQPEVLAKIKHFSCLQIRMLDIDGFRMDKGLQTTVDAMAEFAAHQKECAAGVGKDNFLVVGEVVGEIPLAAIYVGRGKQPDQKEYNATAAVTATNNPTNQSMYLRGNGETALDGAAFHYPTYGAMTRFLGLDGPIGFEGVDFVDHWDKLMQTDDMVNGLTGVFDPRHMYGMTNQDVFRWPSLANGTQRQLLGFLITILEMPGIPMLLWGEEQEYYVLENLASDYVFGRTPMASQQAWHIHGCYQLGEEVYVDMPFESAKYGCEDDSVALDHRDPSHPLRNVLKRMYELRRQYPVLNDGYYLETMSTKLHDVYLPGSDGIPSPTGLWSVYRGRFYGVQDFNGTGAGNQGVWLVFSNENTTQSYTFDCSNSSDALLSPFPPGTHVKNLFYPYETVQLQASGVQFGIDNSTEYAGCFPSLDIEAWGWKAYVPEDAWVEPAPVITRVVPSHDERIISQVDSDETETVDLQIRFSKKMDCDSVKDSLTIDSATQLGVTAQVNWTSAYCYEEEADAQPYVGQVPTEYIFKAELYDVAHGVHRWTLNNASTPNATAYTGAVDHFMFRVGSTDNPIVFPGRANYSSSVLHENESGDLYVSHKAPGADKWKYSLTWGSTWSSWMNYSGGNDTLDAQSWTGTSDQEWSGKHVILNYWSNITGSSQHVQHGDLSTDNRPVRRWPHVFVEGQWNQYGYDGGLFNEMSQNSEGVWEFDLVAEYPDESIINVWGMNPDGVPDKSAAFGDVDNDGVLDWLPPDSLSSNVLNVTAYPPTPYIAWKLWVNDGDYRHGKTGVGSMYYQLFLGLAIAFIPIFTAAAAVYVFMKSFYQVKFNEIGLSEKKNFFGSLFGSEEEKKGLAPFMGAFSRSKVNINASDMPARLTQTAGPAVGRTVLIATMEYDIEDWGIKVKIGGLGVMAQLMGKNLSHQNLIWVVPCVGNIDYPQATPGEPIQVKILGNIYDIEVQYHVLRNITYVLLDAPVFRQQTKEEPYPARMDDLDSAIYYSAWNACIAETIKRFPIDLYHINDYHGAVAPLYLLPRVIPVCLSLHNAEFQGLWPIRTPEEMSEISSVFNLDEDIIKEYVQFGEVFNLLHAGASYLRNHQKGFGAVGVSKKYGKRSFARYPIFWGLSKIGALPNPDPSDTAQWDKKLPSADVSVDQTKEQERGALRTKAQEWAGLNIDPNAELFVFVGRWSMQKGVDLIADVFPSVLEKNKNVQLICIGPVIDLYGKFAALKLERIMQLYPGRVFSKPVFTALPPFIFSGAEFALIPSRDEPFGLVAVEFGRKGALGVGARVGGLGQMPGWWFTIESTTTKHMMRQFKMAIQGALNSSTETRAIMRARSSEQRFPVQQWVEDLEILQTRSIKISRKVCKKAGKAGSIASGVSTPWADDGMLSGWTTAPGTANNTAPPSRNGSRPQSPASGETEQPPPMPSQYRYSLGKRLGPSQFASMNAKMNRQNSMHRPGSAGSSVYTEQTYPDDDSASVYYSHEALPNQQVHTPGRSGLASLAESPVMGPVQGKNVGLAITDKFALDTAHHDFGSSPRSQPFSSPSQTFSSPAQSYPSPESAWNSPNPSEVAVGTAQHPGLHHSKSLLSLTDVVGKRKDYNLQKVDPFFTDSQGLYYKEFEKMLGSLDGKSSEDSLCIEEYLNKSEKSWFGYFHQAKMGKSIGGTPASSIFRMSRTSSNDGSRMGDNPASSTTHLFDLGEGYVAPTGVRKLLSTKIRDWPVYAFLLAFGQIIAANSYQITLITGANGQAAEKLYLVATVYLLASIGWWFVFRRLKAIYCLSLPFLFYGMAFFLLGFSPLAAAGTSRAWVQNVATGLYAIASASGSLFFALNFGSEGGNPVQTWIFRACVVQGTQQIYVTILWYWGDSISQLSSDGVQTSTFLTSKPVVAAITTPIALLMWAVGILLFLGLPNFYRAKPGKVPSFYGSIYRRKIIIWFFIVVVIQNYWLSAPYGRNWRYLWSSQHAPGWAIALLVIIFFVGVWAVMLYLLGTLSKEHSWILPIFAIGLGAPRWAQMLWGTSGIGFYVPWVSSPAAGALLGRSLWLWLGVLDAVQGVGYGMILLQTLTRFHIAFTLIAAQVIGSLATILARATAPDKLGPGTVFPNLGINPSDGLSHFAFWLCLVMQMLVAVGFFAFFRKEQLFKP